MDEILSAIVGGILIGVAASMMMFFNGRIAGISGIFGGLLRPVSRDITWRVCFVGGLIGGGAFLYWINPEAFVFEIERSEVSLAIAGVLVGLGAKIGSGCTSGHGVCGIGRLSPRSVVATMTFMIMGILTVWIINHGLGGAL